MLSVTITATIKDASLGVLDPSIYIAGPTWVCGCDSVCRSISALGGHRDVQVSPDMASFTDPKGPCRYMVYT